MTIGINITKYIPDTIRELMFAIKNFNIEIYMSLEDFTKRDLEDLIQSMEDNDSFGEWFTSDVKELIDELKKLLEHNAGRREKDLIQWVDTKGQTSLDQFFEVYK